MMKDDPAIEEIRETRRKISEQYGNDTYALVKHCQDVEKRYADRVLPVPESQRPMAVWQDE